MVKIRALGSTWLSLSGLSEGCGILTKPRAQNVGTRFDGLSLLRMLKFFLACSVPSAAFESTICRGAFKVDKREDIECPTLPGCSHTHTCTHSLQIRCRYFLEEFQLHPELFPSRSQESPLHHANPALCTQAPHQTVHRSFCAQATIDIPENLRSRNPKTYPSSYTQEPKKMCFILWICDGGIGGGAFAFDPETGPDSAGSASNRQVRLRV